VTAGPGQYGSEQVPAWFVATDQDVILAGRSPRSMRLGAPTGVLSSDSGLS
jgi:hypothetical protein